MSSGSVESARVGMGVPELDDILGGGLTGDRVYLIEGTPGSGKTTLAVQFLREGAARGERGLYVTLSETKAELIAVGESHGWSFDGIEIYELMAADASIEMESQYTMFEPSEVELHATTRAMLAEVERAKPARLVFDSLSEMRLLAQSALRYRRQILALKQFFVGRSCTVLFLDDKTSDHRDLQLQSICHGVLELEQLAPDYGAERRRLRVIKMRGVAYRGGYHDFVIKRGGIEVFPRLVASEHSGDEARGKILSGSAQLDALLGGGIDRGSSVLVLGPAGSGKSSLATQYAVASASGGVRSAFFCFDESIPTLVARSAGLALDLSGAIASGRVSAQQIDPAELSPGEFAHAVRWAVERDGARIVIIDSLNGYLNAMPNERNLTIQLHEILTYLGRQGVVTFLIVAQHGMLGSAMQSPVDASYLADSVILLRYFEAQGSVRQAISVIKKRIGGHERTIREFRMDGGGIQVGEPLRDFQGVLTGVPSYVGTEGPLLGPRHGR